MGLTLANSVVLKSIQPIFRVSCELAERLLRMDFFYKNPIFRIAALGAVSEIPGN